MESNGSRDFSGQLIPQREKRRIWIGSLQRTCEFFVFGQGRSVSLGFDKSGLGDHTNILGC